MPLHPRILALPLSCLLACTHAPDVRRDAPPSQSGEPASVKLLAIVVPAAGTERALALDEHLSERQRFALRVTVNAAVHLYVLRSHPGGTSQLIYHTDGPVTRADMLRIPAADQWISVPALNSGDRLCLVPSTEPLAVLPDCTPEDEDPLHPRHPPPPPPPRERPAPPTKGNTERRSPVPPRIPLPTSPPSSPPSSY